MSRAMDTTIKAIIFDFAGVVMDMASRRPMAGLEEFLQLAQQRQWFCGIASSSPHRLISQFLHDHKLYQYFATIVGSDDVATTKPDPECYLRVAMYFQLSAPQCLVIDDSAPAIAAAKRVHFQTVLFGKDVQGFNELRQTVKP